MRIGLFSDTYLPDINGVATSVATLQKTLEDHGHEVFVVANHKGLLHKQREGNVLRLPGIELKWLYGYIMSSPIQISAMNEIKAMNLDLIHVHTEFGIGMFARMAAKECNIPIVSTYHTMYEDYSHYINIINSDEVEKAAKKAVVSLSRLVADSTEIVISPSEKTKEALVNYGVSVPISVIPTGIDLRKYNRELVDMNLVQQLKNKYGIQKDDRVVLYLGRIAEEKSIDVVIRGFKKAAQDPHNKLMIVGGGPSLEDLKQVAIQENIQDSVIFTDKQDRDLVPAFYVLADAFVSASLSETQGMTFVEALASECVVFARRDGVLEDLIFDGENGFYITEENFSDKLMEFYALDEETKEKMRKKARQNALRYDLETFYQSVKVVYENAIHSYYLTYEIKKVKVNDDIVSLTLEDGQGNDSKLQVSLEDYFAFDLKKDEILHESTLIELRKRELKIQAYQLCIKKLASKDRTRKEMYDILIEDGKLNIQQINEMIASLEERGYINDDEYLAHALEKEKYRFEGKKKIIYELVKKGIPYEKVEAALENNEDDERNKALRYAEKIFNSAKGLSVKMKKQKLISRIMSQGFNFDIARDVVESFNYDEDEANEYDVLEKALNKSYLHYSKKYKGYELRNRVLSQMVRKGFNSEDVLIMLEDMEERNEEN